MGPKEMKNGEVLDGWWGLYPLKRHARVTIPVDWTGPNILLIKVVSVGGTFWLLVQCMRKFHTRPAFTCQFQLKNTALALNLLSCLVRAVWVHLSMTFHCRYFLNIGLGYWTWWIQSCLHRCICRTYGGRNRNLSSSSASILSMTRYAATMCCHWSCWSS